MDGQARADPGRPDAAEHPIRGRDVHVGRQAAAGREGVRRGGARRNDVRRRHRDRADTHAVRQVPSRSTPARSRCRTRCRRASRGGSNCNSPETRKRSARSRTRSRSRRSPVATSSRRTFPAPARRRSRSWCRCGPGSRGADVDWHVSVHAAGLSSKAPVDGRLFSDANVVIDVSPDEVIVKGKAKIDGVLADIDMNEPISDGTTKARAGQRSVRLLLDDNARRRFGIGLDEVLAGTVGALVSNREDGKRGPALRTRPEEGAPGASRPRLVEGHRRGRRRSASTCRPGIPDTTSTICRFRAPGSASRDRRSSVRATA